MAIDVKIQNKSAPKPVAALRNPNSAGTAPVLHYVSDQRKPLKVKNHETNQIREVGYGEYIPEASTWKPHIQASNEKMGVIRRVDAPPPGYKPPTAKVAAPAADKPAKAPATTADAVFAGAPKPGL